jgi:NACHT domain
MMISAGGRSLQSVPRVQLCIETQPSVFRLGVGLPRSSTRRRIGVIYLALTSVALIVALGLSARFHLGVVQTALTIVPSIPGLFLAWASFRWQGDRDPTLDEVADRLAGAVSRQWDAEASLRRLYDPHPLPVAWTPAPPSLVENWESLIRIASEWPDDPAAPMTGWAVDPAELAGSGGELAAVLAQRVPTRRLVVLGAPGAGKTLLLVRLVLDLLGQRESGKAVPVLASLASWNPVKQELHPWLARRLATDYPGLTEPGPTSSGAPSLLMDLLRSRKLFLVLDGLDELPGNLRGVAIAKINGVLRPGEGVVLSSRAEQYRQAVDPADGLPVRLRGAAGIELRDLDAAAAELYLREDAAGPRAAARWDRVFAALRAGGPVAQAFRTPLMVGLARTVYNPRPGEQVESLPDPAELCDSKRFPTAKDIESHLFDAFIPAAYRPGAEHRCLWSADKSERWLAYLARHLTRNLGGTTDIAWWQLRDATPQPLGGLVAGLISGASIGVAAWLGPRLGIGIGVGLIIGLAVGMAVRAKAGPGGSMLGGVASGGAGGILGGFAGGLLSGNGPTAGLVGGAGLGIGVGPVSGLVGAFVGCLAGGLALGATASHATGLAAGLLDGLGAALAAGLCAELAGRHEPARGLRGLHWTPAGLAIGIAGGLGVGITAGIKASPLAGFASGLAVGLVATTALGLQGSPPDSKTTAGPGTSLANDRRTFLAIGSAAGITFGLGGGLGVWIGVGIAAAIAVGLGTSFLQAAYGHFLIATCWLAIQRKLPWRLMTFLADAHEKHGVLRQTGAVYQFKHAELQQRLNDRTDDRTASRQAP